MDLLTQVHSVASAKEALELLASASSGAVPLYDIILKEHEHEDILLPWPLKTTFKTKP